MKEFNGNSSADIELRIGDPVLRYIATPLCSKLASHWEPDYKVKEIVKPKECFSLIKGNKVVIANKIHVKRDTTISLERKSDNIDDI
ncbi:MAG: hypothetical protein KC463_07465 [Streptococcus sp.]|nr:hypothetical protein [Streptococcus sp.]